jgi:DNA-binding SARP family transcriptional activator/pimeloyl-ACP methyl ester carboxylesterase
VTVTVEIDLLGSFRVRVDGNAVDDVAWSRRDAAGLVKLLALQPSRRLHREQVMDRLWPDLGLDEAAPRLHKAAYFARRALDRRDGVVLRGEMVLLLPGVPVTVDALAFEEAAEVALADGGAGAAAMVLDKYGTSLLPEDPYVEWAEEPRERLTLLRTQLLRQARRWRQLVELDPVDEEAHLELVRELAEAGDRRAALRQYEAMDRTLRRELGVAPGPEAVRLREQLVNQLRDAGTMSSADRGRLEQQIKFCRTADGITLAYATSGSGPPLVKAANWLTHVDHDWHSPVWRHWLVDLSQRHRLVRYDERGCGLSDWDIPPPTFESWVQDLESVVDAAGLARFPLLGISQGAGVAVAYAARHPERVTRLVLYGGYAQGRLARAANDEERRMHQLQVDLVRLGWGRDEPSFRQVFTSQFMPEGSRELWAAFNDLQRKTSSPENAARVLELTGPLDVTALARQVVAPTLVLHARHDQRPPFAQGRLLASLIPDCRFVALESHNHILLADEPAWPVFLAEVESFLETDESATGRDGDGANLR